MTHQQLIQQADSSWNPYEKYGLAVYLQQKGADLDIEFDINCLKQIVRSCLNQFRLKYVSVDVEQKMLYTYLNMFDFENRKYLIQSSGLAGKGFHLAPHTILEAGIAKFIYKSALDILNQTDFSKKVGLTKSVSPFVTKVMNPANAQYSSIPYYRFAFNVISNLTSKKFHLINSAIYPDLSTLQLVDWVDLVSDYLIASEEANLKSIKSVTYNKDGTLKTYPKPKVYFHNFSTFFNQQLDNYLVTYNILLSLSKFLHTDAIQFLDLDFQFYIVSQDNISIINLHPVVKSCLYNFNKFKEAVNNLLHYSVINKIENKEKRDLVAKQLAIFLTTFHINDLKKFIEMMTYVELNFSPYNTIINKFMETLKHLTPDQLKLLDDFGFRLNNAAYFAATSKAERRNYQQQQLSSKYINEQKHNLKIQISRIIRRSNNIVDLIEKINILFEPLIDYNLFPNNILETFMYLDADIWKELQVVLQVKLNTFRPKKEDESKLNQEETNIKEAIL